MYGSRLARMMSQRLAVSLFVMLLCFAFGGAALCVQPSKSLYEPDPYVGLYAGTVTDDTGGTVSARAFVYAQGSWLSRDRDVYQARLERKADVNDWEVVWTVTLKPQDGQLAFPGDAGSVDGKTLVCREDGGGRYDLIRTEIPSPTLGEKPPEDAIVLLPYEPGKAPSLEAWDNTTWQAFDDGSMVVGKGDIRTRGRIADISRLHIEFLLPVEPGAGGQSRGNSGVYVHDRYEVQVLDSFGLAPEKNTCGAIYGQYAPLVNAARPAGQWQAYDIALNLANGVILLQVKLNGVEVQPWRKPAGPTGGGAKGGALAAPLRLQDHGHPVQYRNIWVETRYYDYPTHYYQLRQ